MHTTAYLQNLYSHDYVITTLCVCILVQEEQSRNIAINAISKYRVNSSSEYDPVVNAAIDEIQRDVSPELSSS